MTTTLIRAKKLLTMQGWDKKGPLNPSPKALAERDDQIVGLLNDAAILIEDGRISWVGPAAEAPPADEEHNAQLLMPAWTECHTHAIFGGGRAEEFAQRNAGTPYVEVLEAGGGILSTVQSTRKAEDQLLVDTLVERLSRFADQGIGTVEVKTGYGLSLEEELRHLALIHRAGESARVKVISTFLGAHAIPPEWREHPEGYVDLVCDEMLPAVKAQGYARFCDVFCDRGAFNLKQSKRILSTARDLGLSLKIHAEEIIHTGGALMAAELGALSADHLDHLPTEEATLLAKSGCVGVLLPGVTLFLDMADRAPARALIAAGGRVALSTDFNPGSCNTKSLALMTTLGCTQLKMTPGEVLWAVTRGASLAVGEDAGCLRVGAPADLAFFSIEDYREIPYDMGANHATALWRAGTPS